MEVIKVALLDNNDSFTYNIVDYLRRIDNLAFTVFGAVGCTVQDFKRFDKIIISPGPGLPQDFPIISQVLENYCDSKPVLGICLGHQAIGCFFGGGLVNIRPVIHGQAQKVTIVKHCQIFRNLPVSFKVGLYHSWALSPHNFPEELNINAITENETIMAVSSRKYSLFGVQFHPESYITEHGLQILKNFVNTE